ncbi:MAG: LytTR family DNA-binding domain-containing protein [Pseudomonadota bacterium]
MPTAILAEDEPVLRAELRDTLAALWPELQVIAETDDGAATLRAIESHKPDLVFLDISMPHLSGLEVARAVQGKTSVVFLTAYDEHALAAFGVGALDYLVKPLDRGRLLETIARLRKRLENDTQAVPEAVWAALPVAKAAPKYLRWIQASVGSLTRLITTDEVIYFQADTKYTRVVTARAEALIRKPIKDLVEELDPEDFVQISRGAIVNLRRIETIFRSDGHMEVRLRDREERLTVTAGYQSAFRQL